MNWVSEDRIEKSRLTETEEVNEAAWQEICRWADTEWEGGGWVGKDKVKFYAATGAMDLTFDAYKHVPDQPRLLYMIQLNVPALGIKQNLNLIFSEGVEIPVILEFFNLNYP